MTGGCFVLTSGGRPPRGQAEEGVEEEKVEEVDRVTSEGEEDEAVCLSRDRVALDE
jgi:hypothetical protein